MKKYFSVIEAAKLLGVSTNTIYTYLKEGKLGSKRIGKGRIKIPYQELVPFADIKRDDLVGRPIVVTSPVQQEQETELKNVESGGDGNKQEGAPENISDKKVSQTLESTKVTLPETLSPIVTQNGVIARDVNDTIFFRLFKGMAFIGLGVIYFATSKNIFKFGGTFFEEIAQIMYILFPLGFILAGGLKIIETVWGSLENETKKPGALHFFVDLLIILLFVLYAFFSIHSDLWGRLIYAVAFTLIAVSHLIRGIKPTPGRTFADAFITYLIYIALLGGFFITLNPSLFPVNELTGLITEYKGFFAFIWFAIFLIPLLYFLSPYGKKSKLFPVVFGLGSLVGFIFGYESTLASRWDLAYLSYLTSIFALFVAWWKSMAISINPKRFYLVVIAFLWIGVSLLFSIFALKASHEDIKKSAQTDLAANLDQVATKITQDFDNQRSFLISFAADPEVKNIIAETNEEEGIAKTKELFTELSEIKRATIFNAEGIVVAAYPRSSLVQGENFSSREYFRNTKENLKGTISDIFVGVLGDPTFFQTEPIFDGDNFIGVIAINFDPEKFYKKYNAEAGLQGSIFAVDGTGAIVISKDLELVGEKFADSNLQKEINDTDSIVTQQSVRNPKWQIYLVSNQEIIVEKITNIHIYLVFLILANAVLSFTVGIILSMNRQDRKSEFTNNKGSVPGMTYARNN